MPTRKIPARKETVGYRGKSLQDSRYLRNLEGIRGPLACNLLAGEGRLFGILLPVIFTGSWAFLQAFVSPT